MRECDTRRGHERKMRFFLDMGCGRKGGSDSRFPMGAMVALMALLFCLSAGKVRAQIVFAGDQGGFKLSAGSTGSGYYLQYGQRKLLGLSAIVDADTKRRIGVEAEGRWLEYHQSANVHVETYSVGGRYHFDVGRFQPYAKGLIGLGDFHFPYNYAQGHYLVLTAGGGLDFHWTRAIYVRAADVEFQEWPQFTFGNMTSVGVSAGFRVRVF
jgi:hypothetical protein